MSRGLISPPRAAGPRSAISATAALAVAGQRVAARGAGGRARRLRWLRGVGVVAVVGGDGGGGGRRPAALGAHDAALRRGRGRGAGRLAGAGPAHPGGVRHRTRAPTSGASIPTACGPGWRRCRRSGAPTSCASCPNRVTIVVEERRPFTLVHAARLHWLDEEGRLLGEESRAVATEVPVISGLSEDELATMRTSARPAGARRHRAHPGPAPHRLHAGGGDLRDRHEPARGAGALHGRRRRGAPGQPRSGRSAWPVSRACWPR